jgi:1-deoxy-D-xylulose-5-phosphate synthase
LSEHGLLDRGLAVRSLMLPDRFIDQDTPAAMYAQAELDQKAIVAKVVEVVGGQEAVEDLRLAQTA